MTSRILSLSKRPTWRTVILFLLFVGLGATAPCPAASPGEQKAQLRRVGTYLRSAERLHKAGRTEDALEAFATAESLLAEVGSEEVDGKVARYFQRTQENLIEAHAELTKAGLKLPELKAVEMKTPTMQAGGGGQSTDAPQGEPGGRFDPNNVSFVRDVAPMLVAKCGSCHINGKKGGFSLATFRDLMQGTEGVGRVLVPGDGMTSHIVDLIVSGSMPPNGNQVSPADTQKLVAWITQGAKFDGDSETTNLRALKSGDGTTPAPTPAAQPDTMKIARATGKETVSFALDVAPILSNHCLGCHGLGNNPRANLNMATFRRLMQGGDSGPAIRAGAPETSGLVRRLTGEDTPRMPLNQPPLSDKQIETLTTWVREGAKFDGEDAAASLDRVTNLLRAKKASPEELNAMRQVAADRNWRLAAPDVNQSSITTNHFRVVGNLPEARLQEIGGQAEQLATEIVELFGHPEGKPLAKGRITLYALAGRIDYSEFRLMVQKQQAAREDRGTFGYDVVDAYVAAQLGVEPTPADQLVLAEQIAAAYLSERTTGRLPDWLIEGAARTAAARSAPKDEQVLAWRDSFPSELAKLKDPKDLLNDKLPPSTAGVLRYAFTEGLIRKPDKLRTVIADVAAGMSVDAAFTKSFKYTPEQLAPLWVQSIRRRR